MHVCVVRIVMVWRVLLAGMTVVLGLALCFTRQGSSVWWLHDFACVAALSPWLRAEPVVVHSPAGCAQRDMLHARVRLALCMFTCCSVSRRLVLVVGC